MAEQALNEEKWTTVRSWFPELKDRNECHFLGPETAAYNCIGWSVGREDLWINPPPTQEELRQLYAQFDLTECNEESNALVDSYFKDNIPTHGSRCVDGRWTSKLGEYIKMSHPRDGLIGEVYGQIGMHFGLSSLQSTSQKSSVGRSRPDPQAGPPLALEAVMKLIKDNFPQTVCGFDKNWDRWMVSWDQIRPISSSVVVAHGVEWDKLVDMGIGILPLVVAKLAGGDIFGCHLYNRLQSDAAKKVQQSEGAEYWVLNWQAQRILKLYEQQLATFQEHVASWKTQLDSPAVRLSSNSSSRTSLPAYQSLIAMGLPIIPLIMVQYACDPQGWWYLVLHEIVFGNKDESQFSKRKMQYKAWSEWFQTKTPIPDLEGEVLAELQLQYTHLHPGVRSSGIMQTAKVPVDG